MTDSSCDNCDLSQSEVDQQQQQQQPQPSSSSSSSSSSVPRGTTHFTSSQNSDQVSLCQEDASQHQAQQQQHHQEPSVNQPLAFASDTSNSSPGDHNNQPIIDESDSTLVPRDLNKLAQDKEAVYKHPLFPLLALLLEKCEYATATLGQQTAPAFTTKDSANGGDSNDDDDSSISPPSSPLEHVRQGPSSLLVSPAQQSFNQQVQAFVDLHEKQGKPLLVEDEEINTLMIKAIQVLRINLLELEKVQELCKDFCQRYITCLRTKMSSENLLRGTTAFGSGGHGGLGFDASSRSSSPSSDDNSMPPAHPHHSRHQRRLSSIRHAAYDSYSSGRQDMSPLESGQQVDSISQHMSFDANDVQRDSGNEGDLSDDAASNAYHGGSDGNGGGGGGGSGGGRNGGSGSASAKQKTASKRGILPKQATSIMRSWLFQHIVHPYPTEDEKRAIAGQTNLTLLQVNNWFINARRRILQPMLDSANTVGNSENNSNNSTSANGNSANSVSLGGTGTNGNSNNNITSSTGNNNGKLLSIALSSPSSNGTADVVTTKKLKTTSQQPKASISAPQMMWPLDAISPRSSTD